MSKKELVLAAIGSALLFFGLATAQQPVENIDKTRHPNLAAAQHHLVEANRAITASQQASKGNPKFTEADRHCEQARQLLVQADQEIQYAARAANAEMQK